MTLYVSIVGIDGSGKSTITAALCEQLATRYGLTSIALGEHIGWQMPSVVPADARVGWAQAGLRGLRQCAKATTGQRWLYPLVKLLHLAAQEVVGRWLARAYQPDMVLCDGHLLISAAARVVNYEQTVSPACTTLHYLDTLYECVVAGGALPPESLGCMRLGLRLLRWLHGWDERSRLGVLRLPDVLVVLDVTPEVALQRIHQRGKRLDQHENLDDLAQARQMYLALAAFVCGRQETGQVAIVDVRRLGVDETLALLGAALTGQPGRAVGEMVPQAPCCKVRTLGEG